MVTIFIIDLWINKTKCIYYSTSSFQTLIFNLMNTHIKSHRGIDKLFLLDLETIGYLSRINCIYLFGLIVWKLWGQKISSTKLFNWYCLNIIFLLLIGFPLKLYCYRALTYFGLQNIFPAILSNDYLLCLLFINLEF